MDGATVRARQAGRRRRRTGRDGQPVGHREGRGLQRRRVRDCDHVGAILRATTPSIGFYVGFLLLALAAPRAAAFGYLLVAVVGVLRARGDEASPQTVA